jgi:hypothetical protein
MTANLSVLDKYNRTPTAAVVGEPHGPTHYRAELSQLTENETWLFNRLAKIFGTYQLIEATDGGTDKLTITAHSIPANTVARVESVGGAVPAGLSATVAYYVLVSDANNIQLSLTSGGAAVDITGAGTGTLYLYTVPDMLGALLSTAFTTAAGNTIAPGSLRTMLAGFLPVSGGTMTGPFKASGTGAYKVERDSTLPDVTPTTFTPLDNDWLYCPDVSAATTYLMANGTEEGQTFTVTRRKWAGGFTAGFRDAGGVAIYGRFTGLGVGWMRFRWENQEGAGFKWHISEWGGEVDALQ